VNKKKRGGEEGWCFSLGFAREMEGKERGCKDKWRGRVPCNGMHAHVTRWVIAKD
jgi:hypothetical protein